tara:strand:+ start:2587 stop:3273 length:687 start_codon:yes stop_codon:yes gene_type:complete
MNFKKYKSIIFDCDGVILDSNKIKTEAFRLSTRSYGEEYSEKLVSYHLLNGGVSRYEKFNYFLNSILRIKSEEERKNILIDLLKIYETETTQGLLNCEVTFGLKELRSYTKGTPWFVVSGGDEKQLTYIFKEKKIYDFFDGGIYGSPDSKDHIIKREIKSLNIKFPSLLLGDSKLDYEVSSSNKIDFVFLSKWTEFISYESFCKRNGIIILSRVHDLIKHLSNELITE